MLPPDPDLTSTPLSSWPLPAHAQKALICGLFQRPSTSSLGTLTVSRYLEYYRSQCTRFSSLAAAAAVAQTSRPRSSIASSARPLTAESELSKTSSRPSVLGGEPQKEQQLAALTHADLVAVAAMLMEGMSRQEVAEQMRSRQLQGGDSRSAGGLLAGGPATAVNAKAVERTIDLVVSLLIMVEVGAHDLMGRHGGPSGAPLYWASAGSLADFVCGQLFALPEKPLELGGMRAGIEKGFNARSLMRVGGMTVKWTTNLADHLRLADDDKTVFVFHFAGFLQLQRSLGSDLFPAGFADETIRTLALLFPQNDASTQRWIRRQVRHQGIDPLVGKCGSLTAAERRFDRFLYWHDRLVILKESYDEARPRSLVQLWFDRRNLGQWRLFWLGIVILLLIIAFGILGRIESAIQIKIAKKMIHVISKGTEGPR